MRRLATALAMLAMVALLVVAARHNHFESLQRCSTAACVFCSGAVAVAPELPDLSPLALPAPPLETAPTIAPDRRYLLPLEHSGCAPPQSVRGV